MALALESIVGVLGSLRKRLGDSVVLTDFRIGGRIMEQGRVAIITGGASGIGRASALELHGRGFKVAVTDMNINGAAEVVEEICAMGGYASAYQLDVSSLEQIGEVVSSIDKEYGRIDVLVTSAGITGFEDFRELTEQHWARMLDVNARGTVFMTQAVLPFMTSAGYGRIVCIASVGAFNGSIAHSHYAASKGAVISFTKALCKEIGPAGITINAIAPGVIDTPLLSGIPEYRKAEMARNPVGRPGTAEDVAHAVSYLASERASFVTGTVLHVNGGYYT
jgi:2-hydroxycyclohexanecarboxyl-CoA dehydrogenase